MWWPRACCVTGTEWIVTCHFCCYFKTKICLPSNALPASSLLPVLKPELLEWMSKLTFIQHLLLQCKKERTGWGDPWEGADTHHPSEGLYWGGGCKGWQAFRSLFKKNKALWPQTATIRPRRSACRQGEGSGVRKMTETESLCFKSQEERVFLTHGFSGDRQAPHRYFKIQSVLLYLPRGMEQAVGRTRSSPCWYRGKGLQTVDACFPSLSNVCSRKRAGAGGGGSFGRKKQK